MHKILDSVAKVVLSSKEVSINHEAIHQFCQTAKKDDLKFKLALENFILPGNNSVEREIAFCIVLEALMFSFWSDPQWCIHFSGKEYSGSIGMEMALKRALSEGVDILNPETLQNLSLESFGYIFRGNIEIPLAHERLQFLQKLGKIIIEKFNGTFTHIITLAQGNAEKIVGILVGDFAEIFADEGIYNNQKVYFYKRAQLVPIYLYQLSLIKSLPFSITGIEWLTGLADYKIPQLLREFNILNYSPNLSNKINSKIEFEFGSEEEVEIRANCIWAIHILTQKVKEKFSDYRVADIQVNELLWNQRSKITAYAKPYHRVRSIWY